MKQGLFLLLVGWFILVARLRIDSSSGNPRKEETHV